MKIIHCADIHLDSAMNTKLTNEKALERRRELVAGFVGVVEYAVRNNVRAIIIAGDMFDVTRVTESTKDVVFELIEKHKEIDFYYLRGNHDKGCFVDELDYIPDNLLLFGDSWISYVANDKGNGNIVVTGIERLGNDRDVYDELELDEDDFNVVVLHGSCTDSYSMGEETVSLRNLSGRFIDYLALGHIHSYKEGMLDPRGMYCYPGCLIPRGFDECGEHGFVVLDIDEKKKTLKRKFVKIPGRIIYNIPADITGCNNSTQAAYVVESALRENNCPEDSMVRVTLCGRIDVESDIDTLLLEKLFAGRFYYLEVCDNTDIYVDYNSYSHSPTLKGEFIRTVISRNDLSDEDKSEIIKIGLRALSGEEF